MKKNNKLILGISLLPVLVSGLYLQTISSKADSNLTSKQGKIIQGSTIESITAGTRQNSSFSGAIVNDGENDILYTWGNNTYGQLGYDLPSGSKSSWIPLPVDINGSGDPYDEGQLSNLAMGESFSGVVANNGTAEMNIYTWGNNSYGQLGNGTLIGHTKPTPILFESPSQNILTVETLDFNEFSSAMIFNDGDLNFLYTWGSNWYGGAGIGTESYNPKSPEQVGITELNVNAFSNNGRSMEIALTNPFGGADLLYGWGYNDVNQLGLNSNEIVNPSPTRIKIDGAGTTTEGHITKISGGTYTTGLIMDNQLYTTGSDYSGSLGNGQYDISSDVYKVIETPEGTITDLNMRYGFNNHLLINNQDVYGWGYNQSGQLGTGDLIHRDAPTLIDTSMLEGTIVQMTDGWDSFFLLCYDGLNYKLYASGQNDGGQLAIDRDLYPSAKFLSLTPTLVETNN